MSASSAPPRPGISLLRIVVALVLTAVAFGAIVAGTYAVGYGRDLHPLRVAVAVSVLAPAMLVVAWAGCSASTRSLALVVGLLLAGFAWWFVPCRINGPDLLKAASQRDAMNYLLATLPPDDVKMLPQIRRTLTTLAEDYSTLSETAMRDADRRSEEAVSARLVELRELSAKDPGGFEQTAVTRRVLVDAFPESRERLIEAERKWAERYANFMAVAYTDADMTPKHIREGYRDVEKYLAALRGLDDSPARLAEARRVLFRAADESARAEIRELHTSERFERAFGIALAHEFEWSQRPGLLSDDELKKLDELREQCRALLRPGGDPEIAPPPRTPAIAPEPRPKP